MAIAGMWESSVDNSETASVGVRHSRCSEKRGHAGIEIRPIARFSGSVDVMYLSVGSDTWQNCVAKFLACQIKSIMQINFRTYGRICRVLFWPLK